MRLPILLAAVLIAGSCASAAPGASPTDPKVCAALGGQLQKVCRSQTLACLVPFRDAGKPCTDKSQCQGRCLAVGRPDMGVAVAGRCETNHGPCGCFTTVVRGKVDGSICVD